MAVFERPPDSGVWWISYFDAEGNRRREKVGRRKAAEDLYSIRRSAVVEGRKLPTLRRGDKLMLADLVDLALAYTVDHKDRASYESKANIIKADPIGSRPAEEITPQELDKWLTALKRSPGTLNKYRAFFSLCYREGIANGKVTINPARLTRQRKVNNARQRYLSKDEYAKLLKAIRELHPDHEAEFVISVHTGMRLSEQFSLTWNQVDLDRRAVRLTETKNGSARTVRLNKESVAAFESLKEVGQKGSAKVWNYDTTYYRPRKWFESCLETAGIAEYTWHCNRHTFCSWLAMAGASIKDIQELAGHKTIQMAARYSHLSPEHQYSVLDRL